MLMLMRVASGREDDGVRQPALVAPPNASGPGRGVSSSYKPCNMDISTYLIVDEEKYSMCCCRSSYNIQYLCI